ncbi:RNA polymerase sigma-70 factor [uncultured Kriegella sp.]|uniref:RNA polymerase sigma factor n=1 Tax=uncultured Kriegella sp. TaxID=1798910 RepID=UPI0030D8EDBB|tara:strand:- start:45088 stop:45669 length:582 start_codon:yes stop_codon:yes gene_type:complete
MNDNDMVKALKKGDKIAFKYLFNTYYNRLVAYIITYSHDKAQSEDIVQQTFIKLWENRQKLDDSKSPKGYLYAIAHNIYIDAIKTSKKHEKIMNLVWESALRDRIEEDFETQEIRIQKMKRVVENLPPKCKKIIHMNKVQGIKYQEIADQMGISIKTVESQMRIAFIKIREAFKEDNVILFFLFRELRNSCKK